MSDFFFLVERYRNEGVLDSEKVALLTDFYHSYKEATLSVLSETIREKLFQDFVEKIAEVIIHPPKFQGFHQALRKPFDYYQFGLDLIRPLIDFDRSFLLGTENLQEIRNSLKCGENVILLANHQTVPDPQIINLMLEKLDSELAQKMIFVAGDRVTTDPLAIPMSLGCNLLCIHSKRHMNDLPFRKKDKILHNQKTMKKMEELLSKGGCCLYVAPSGGRDRPDEQNKIKPALLDADSIELFWLIAKNAEKHSHFYPLTLKTHDLLPPPLEIGKELGEKRLAKRTPVSLFFGEKISMEPPQEFLGKKKGWREERAKQIWIVINKNYDF